MMKYFFHNNLKRKLLLLQSFLFIIHSASSHGYLSYPKSFNAKGKDENDKAIKKKDRKMNKSQENVILHFEKNHVQQTKSEEKDENKNQHPQDMHHHETDHLSVTELIIMEPSNTVTVKASYDATVSKLPVQKSYNRFEQALTTRSKPTILSFIQFNLSEEQINNDNNNAQQSITSAKLNLFTLSRIAPKCQIMVKPARGSFNEKSTSWENAPKKTGPPNTRSLGPEKAKARTWITFDITEAVKWNINKMNSTIITLRLSSKSSRLVAYASRDFRNGLYAPQLIMEMGSTVKPAEPVSIQPKPIKPIASSNDSKPKPTPKPKQKPTSKPTRQPQGKPSSNVINYNPNGFPLMLQAILRP